MRSRKHNDQSRRAINAFAKSVRKKQVQIVVLIPPTAGKDSNSLDSSGITEADSFKFGSSTSGARRESVLPDIQVLSRAQQADLKSHRNWEKRHKSVAARRITLQRSVIRSRAYLADSGLKVRDRRTKTRKLFKKWARTAIRLNKKHMHSNHLNTEDRVKYLKDMVSCDAKVLGLHTTREGRMDLTEAKKCIRAVSALSDASNKSATSESDRFKRHRKQKKDSVGYYDPASGFCTELVTQTFLDYLLQEWQLGYQARHEKRFQTVIGDFSVGLLHAQSSRDIRYALHGIWQLTCGPENWVDELLPSAFDSGEVIRAILKMVHYNADAEVQVQALGVVWCMSHKSNEIAKTLARMRVVALLCSTTVPTVTEPNNAKTTNVETSISTEATAGAETQATIDETETSDPNKAEVKTQQELKQQLDNNAVMQQEHALWNERTKHEFLLGILCLLSTFTDSSAAFDVRTESSIRFVSSYLTSDHPAISATAKSYAVRVLVNVSNSEHLCTGMNLATCCVLFKLLEKQSKNMIQQRTQSELHGSSVGGRYNIPASVTSHHITYCCVTILSRAIYHSPQLAKRMLSYQVQNPATQAKLRSIDFIRQFSLERGTVSDMYHATTTSSRKPFALAFRRACCLFLSGILEGVLLLPTHYNLVIQQETSAQSQIRSNLERNTILEEEETDSTYSAGGIYALDLQRVAESFVRASIMGDRRNCHRDIVTEEYATRGLVRLCATCNCPTAMELLVSRLTNGTGEIVASIVSQGICIYESVGFPKRAFEYGVYDLLVERLIGYQNQQPTTVALKRSISDISEALAVMSTRVSCDQFVFDRHVKSILQVLETYKKEQDKTVQLASPKRPTRSTSTRTISLVHNIMIVCCNLVAHEPIANNLCNDDAGMESLAEIVLNNPQGLPEAALFTGITLLWRLISASEKILHWAIHEKGLLDFIYTELVRVRECVSEKYEELFCCSPTTTDTIREIQELTVGSHPLNGPFYDDSINAWVIYKRNFVSATTTKKEDSYNSSNNDETNIRQSDDSYNDTNKQRPQSGQSHESFNAQQQPTSDSFLGPVCMIHSMKSEAFHSFLRAKANHTALELAIRKRKLKDLLAHNLANNSANATMISLSIPFINQTKALIDDFKTVSLEPVDDSSSSDINFEKGSIPPIVYDSAGKPTETSLLRIEAAILKYDSVTGKMMKRSTTSQTYNFELGNQIGSQHASFPAIGNQLPNKGVSFQEFSTLPSSPKSQISCSGRLSVSSTMPDSNGAYQSRGSPTNGKNVTADALKKNLQSINKPFGNLGSQVYVTNMAQYRKFIQKLTPKLQILLDLLCTVLDDTCHDTEPDRNMFTRELCSEVYFFGFNSDMATEVRLVCAEMLSKLLIIPVKRYNCVNLYGMSCGFYLTRLAHLLSKIGLEQSPSLQQCSAIMLARICDTVPAEQLINTISSSGAIGALVHIVSEFLEHEIEHTRMDPASQEAVSHALFTLRALCSDDECQQTISENGGFQILLELSATCNDELVRDLSFDVLSLIKKHPSNVSRMYLASIEGTDRHWREHIRRVQLSTWDPKIQSIELKHPSSSSIELTPLIRPESETSRSPALRSGRGISASHDSGKSSSRRGKGTRGTTSDVEGSRTHRAGVHSKTKQKQQNESNSIEIKAQSRTKAIAAKSLVTKKLAKITWGPCDDKLCVVKLKGQGNQHFIFDANEPRTQLNVPRFELIRFPKYPNTRILPEVPVFELPDGRQAHFYLKGEPPLKIFHVNFEEVEYQQNHLRNKQGTTHKKVCDVRKGSRKSLARVTIVRHGALQTDSATKLVFSDLGVILQSPPGPRPEQYPPGLMSTHRFLGQKGSSCGKVLDEPICIFRWFDEAPAFALEGSMNNIVATAGDGDLPDSDHSDIEQDDDVVDGDVVAPLTALGGNNSTTRSSRTARHSSIGVKWNIGQSMFHERARSSDSNTCWNTSEVDTNCFEWDWQICQRKQTFNRMLRKYNDSVSRVTEILREHYGIICSLFRYFCASDDHNIFSMGANEFRIFVSVASIIDPNSTLCQQGHLDTVFVAGCYNSGQFGAKVAKRFNEDCKVFQLDKNDRVLLRWEFTECLVRIAETKYIKCGVTTDLAEAVQLLWCNCLEIFAREPLLDYDSFRTNRLYVHQVDWMFRQRCDDIRQVFNMYTGDCGGRMTSHEATTWGSQANARMSLRGWSMLVEDLGLVSANFGRMAVHQVFSMSFLSVINPIRNWRRACSLCFIGFLEAVARLADIIIIPSQEQLNLLGATDIVDFYYIAESTGLINEELFALDETAKDSLQLLCRRNKVMATVPSIPLAQKLASFLDLLLSIRGICDRRNSSRESWDKNTPKLQVSMSRRARSARASSGMTTSSKKFSELGDGSVAEEDTSQNEVDQTQNNTDLQDIATESNDIASSNVDEPAKRDSARPLPPRAQGSKLTFKTGKPPKQKTKSHAANEASFEESVAGALHDAWRETRRIEKPAEDIEEVEQQPAPNGTQNGTFRESKKDSTNSLEAKGVSEQSVATSSSDLMFEPRFKQCGGRLVDIANLSFGELPLVFRLENLLAAYNACEAIRKGIDSLGRKKRNQRTVLTLLTSDSFVEQSCATQHDAWVQRNKSHADQDQLVSYTQLNEAQKKNVRTITRTAISIYCSHVYGATVYEDMKE